MIGFIRAFARFSVLGLVLLGLAQPAAAAHRATVKPGLARELAALRADQNYGAFLHFAKGSTLAQQNAVIARLGLQIAADFRKYSDSVYVSGAASAFRLAIAEPSIYYIEQNRQLRFFNDTGPWSTRVRVAQESVAGGPYKDAGGRILLGQGIGVGIVDSGINAIHPDLTGRVGSNFKIACPGFIFVNPPPIPATENGCVFQDVGNTATTDQGGGHGTHVSGIVAGDGSASTASYAVGATPNVPGSFAGVAPSATLHGFSTGEGINVLYSTQSIQYILDHFEEFTPRIRVTNHSYGVGVDTLTGQTDPHDPSDTEAQLARALVQTRDVVMVYAAGNDGSGAGDDGSARQTSGSCQNPEPGIICAAGHYDGDTGNPEFGIYPSTSRGLKSEINSYPDLAAPAHFVTSTCGPGAGPICQSIPSEATWGALYGTISGTSMAAPHVAGAVALIRQARPDLTAPQIEKLLKKTARKVSYAGAYITDTRATSDGGTTNFAVGAGLLDLQAALDSLGVSHPGLPSVTANPPEVVLLDADTDNAQTVAGAADVVKLTVQEAARGSLASGLTFRIALRDAAAFGAHTGGIGYRLAYNVAGIAHETNVDYLADSSPVGAGGNAAPASVAREGNLIHVFVPIDRLGNPPIGTPIHNLRIRSIDLANSGLPSLDRAPSLSGSTGVQADLQPAFAMPYTIQRPILGGGDAAGNACVAPGIGLLEDGQGDLFALTGASPQNNAAPAFDIRKLSVIQPYGPSDYKIELDLKMQDFTVLPAGTWPVSFCSAGFACVNPDSNTMAYGAQNKYYTVRMTTDSAVATGASPTAPVFQLLQPTTAGNTTGSRTIKSLTGLGSSYQADGLIRFVLKASDIGLTGAGAGLESLSKFQVRVAPAGAGVTPDNMPDALVGEGRYQTLPLDQCDPDNLAPVASLLADRTSGYAPQTVQFTVSASDPGDRIVRYVLDFGDDSQQSVSSPSLPAVVTHVYPEVGSYQARLIVIDGHQKASEAAVQTITVTPKPENLPPTAALTASPLSGHGPLTVQLNAAGSSDSDGQIVEYRFSFGDGSEDKSQAGPTLSHVYTRAGSYVATVTVLDDFGAVSDAASSAPISVQNQAPIAVLAIDPAQPQVGQAVQLSATDSSDPDGDALTAYRFDCGNGVIKDGTESSVGCLYEQAGDYTVSLIVTDSLDSDSAPVSRTLTVTEAQAQNPTPFTFLERSNVPTSTFITSEMVTVEGYRGLLPISVGAGGQYRIGSGSFTNSPGQIAADSKLQVRHVSSSSENTPTTTTVTVGSYQTPFKSTTTTLDRTPGPFDFGTKTNQVPATLVESDVVVPSGYDEGVDLPVVPGPGASYRIDGGTWTTANGKLRKGQSVQLRHTTNGASLGYTKTYLKVGGVIGYFTTRTQK